MIATSGLKISLAVALLLTAVALLLTCLSAASGQSPDERITELRDRETKLLAELEAIRAQIRDLEPQSYEGQDHLGYADLITPTELLARPSLTIGGKLADLPQGTRLEVLLVMGGYARVRYEGAEGYVFAGYLDSSDVSALESRQKLMEEAYREALLVTQLFQGDLAKLDEKQRGVLLRIAKVARPVGLSIEEYKAKKYLAVDLGAPTSVFNSLQLSGPERAARVIGDKFFATVKLFGLVARTLPGVSGVKVTISIPHRDFQYSEAAIQIDNLEIYASSAKIRGFADADISAQELLDSSTVLVNSNRMELDLTFG